MSSSVPTHSFLGIPRLVQAAGLLRIIAIAMVVCGLTGPVIAQQVNLQDILRGGGVGVDSVGAGQRPKPAAGTREPGVLDADALGRTRAARGCVYYPTDEFGKPVKPRLAADGAQLGAAEAKDLSDTMRILGDTFYYPGPFELYVKSVTGQELCRYGFQVADNPTAFFEPPPLAAVPEDYVLGPGDEVFVRLWGSVEQDVALTIDRSGQAVLPRVGPIKLGGVRYGEAAKVVGDRVKRLFSNFNVSVSLGQMRGIRVYVSGYVEKPGSYSVNNLSSLSSVLMAAGGPSREGSFRNIELRRAGKVVSSFDLYDLLLRGNKDGDRVLLNEDVIYVGPVGSQVAIFGGVLKPAVFEVKQGETLNDVVKMAGGFSPGVDAQSLRLLPISGRQAGFRALEGGSETAVANGDVYLAKDNTRVAQPSDKLQRRVLVEGQVRNPGEYFLPPNASLNDAIDAAGGLTQGAYLYGLKLTRESVRIAQEASLRRVLRELDRDLVAASTITPANADEARLLQVRADLSKTLVDRLQTFKPEGRVTLPISPQSGKVPLAGLEDGDKITIPSIPHDVGVFGSVVNPGSFLFVPNANVSEYVELAGGARKGSDLPQAFVIRANGAAKKLDKESSWYQFDLSDPLALQVYPGDTVVVPENMNKTTVFREVSSFATLLYQLGLGAAAIKVLQN